jgi:hypothetical protein
MVDGKWANELIVVQLYVEANRLKDFGDGLDHGLAL